MSDWHDKFAAVRALYAHHRLVRAQMQIVAREFGSFPVVTHRDKCRRRRTDGPTPCLCCPGECVG